MTPGDNTTVAAGYAAALLDLAVSKGASRTKLIERSRIDPNDLLRADGRIPITDYMALLNAGVDLCSEPALSLLFGEEVAPAEVSFVALIAQAAETTGEALRQTNRYARLMIDGDNLGAADLIEVVREGAEVWIELQSRIYVDYPQVTESAFSRMVCSFRRLFGERPFAKAVHFTHAVPSYRSEYDRIFKVPVCFNSKRNALLIDESSLSLKMAPTNRYVFGLLSRHADELLRERERSGTARGQVESLIIPILHTGDVSMDLIAERLGISRQTLYRRLKMDGVTFEAVFDKLRHQMALHYLSGKKASVKETAYLVGFSEPSAFSRAFKRWTGTSPGKVSPQDS